MADDTTTGTETPTVSGTAAASETTGAAQASRSTSQKLKDEAGKIGTQAADRARDYADMGKERATGALDEFARLMTDAAGEVDQRLGADYGKYARSAADGISGLSDSLRSKQVDDLLADAQAFVRKSPAIAIGTAAAVGFVLARLIKSGVEAAGEDSETSPTA